MTLPEHSPVSSPDSRDMSAWANLLRAAILAIPEAQRNMLFEQVRDVLPSNVALRKPPGPQRGSPLLNNIYELFKNDPGAHHAAADVVAALEKRGAEADPKPVRYALNYLENRRYLRRVGYGLYQLASGEIVQGSP